MKFPVLSSPAVISTLAAVDNAIERAYDVTRADLQGKHLDDRIEKTLHPQQLHHNVNQQVCDIGDIYPEMVTDLPPNRRRSHYHVIVTVESVLITVSAVPAPHRVPRRAVHRSRYAMCQRYFRATGSRLEVVPVPDPYDQHSLYIQVLHGPEPGYHFRHGFTVIRMLDADDRYLPDIIDLGEHLASVTTSRTDIEYVTEDFQIIAAVPEEGSQNAFR